MTRRLEPDDRVRELGDVGVPFLLDIHAMPYSDDAPALENAFYAEYEIKRTNVAKFRTEFLRGTIAECEEVVKCLAPEANFFRDI